MTLLLTSAGFGQGWRAGEQLIDALPYIDSLDAHIKPQVSVQDLRTNAFACTQMASFKGGRPDRGGNEAQHEKASGLSTGDGADARAAL